MWTAKAKASNSRAWRKPATPGRQRVARPRRGEPAPFWSWSSSTAVLAELRPRLAVTFFHLFSQKSRSAGNRAGVKAREKAPEKARDQNGAAPLFQNGDGLAEETRLRSRACVGVNGCLLVLRARARPGSQTEPASLIRSRPKSPTTAVRSSHGLGRECNREPERETEREREIRAPSSTREPSPVSSAPPSQSPFVSRLLVDSPSLL